MPCNRFAEAEGRASLLQVQQQGHREVEQLLRQVGMHPAGAQCLAFSAYSASLSISSPETAQFCRNFALLYFIRRPYHTFTLSLWLLPAQEVDHLDQVLEEQRLQAALNERKMQQLLGQERLRGDQLRMLRDNAITQR